MTVSTCSLTDAEDSNDEDDLLILVHEDEVQVVGAIMMQLSLKQGIMQFGGKAREGAMKEPFSPRDPRTLTKEERIRALLLL